MVSSGDPEKAVDLCKSSSKEDIDADDFVYALNAAIQNAEAQGNIEAANEYKSDLANEYKDEGKFEDAAAKFNEIGDTNGVESCIDSAISQNDLRSAVEIEHNVLGNSTDSDSFKDMLSNMLDNYINNDMHTSEFGDMYQVINESYPEYTIQDFNTDIANGLFDIEKSGDPEKALTNEQYHDIFDSMYDLEKSSGNVGDDFSKNDMYDTYFDGKEELMPREMFFDTNNDGTASHLGGDSEPHNFEEIIPASETGSLFATPTTVEAPVSTDSSTIDINAMSYDALREFIDNNILNGNGYDTDAISTDTKIALTDKEELEGLKASLEGENGLDLSDTATLETVKGLLDDGVLAVAEDVKAGIEKAIDNALVNDSYSIPDDFQQAIEQGIRDSEFGLSDSQIDEINNAALDNLSDTDYGNSDIVEQDQNENNDDKVDARTDSPDDESSSSDSVDAEGAADVLL